LNIKALISSANKIINKIIKKMFNNCKFLYKKEKKHDCATFFDSYETARFA